MSSSPMAMQTQEPPAEGPAPRPGRSRGWHPAAAASAAALLLWAAFPPAGWSWLAWGALAPLFALVPSDRPRGAIYLGAWLGGLTFWIPAIQWIRLTDPTAWLAWLALAVALSAWWPAFVGLARLAVRRLGWPLMVAAPTIWVGLEFLRAHVLTGFPWYYLAHSQHAALPLIQVADLTGALGVSLLVATVNVLIVELVRAAPAERFGRPQLGRVAAVAAILGASLLYGAHRLNSARFRPGPRLALIQSNFPQYHKFRKGFGEIVGTFEALVSSAVRVPESERPDLIIWPETSFPHPFIAIEPGLPAEDLLRQSQAIGASDVSADFWPGRARQIAEILHGWADRIGVPMLIGVQTNDFRRAGVARYNSAVLVVPGSAEVQSYHKLHLVPFGEYVPLLDLLPWLTLLTPFRGDHVPSLAPGPAPSWFDLDGARMAAAICFEDTVPQVVRRFFAEAPGGRPPDVLLNLSNDGWFHNSEELDIHLAISTFRAVENRVPLARAVNTGCTALIDGNGRILRALPKGTTGVLAEFVPLDDRNALYSAWGDWFGWSCLVLALVPVPWSLARRLRRPGQAEATAP